MPFTEGQPVNHDKLSGLQAIDPRDLPPNVIIPRWYHRLEDVQPQLGKKAFLARGVVIGDPHIPGQVRADSLLVDCLPTEPVTCQADYDKLLAKAHYRLTSAKFYQYVRQFGIDPTRLDCQYFFQEQFGRDDRLNIIALKTSAGYHFEVWNTDRDLYGSITGDTDRWEDHIYFPSLHPAFPDRLKSIYDTITETQPPTTSARLLEMVIARPYLFPSTQIALVQQRQIPNPNLLHGFTYEEHMESARNPNLLAQSLPESEMVVKIGMNYLYMNRPVIFPDQPYILVINADALKAYEYPGPKYQIHWGNLRGIIFSASSGGRSMVLLGHAGLGFIQYALNCKVPVYSIFEPSVEKQLINTMGKPVWLMEYRDQQGKFAIEE